MTEADHRPPTRIATWQEAEIVAADHMRGLGFSDAAVTKAGADGGIDVEAGGAVAQVKFHAVPVGSPDVQRLRRASHRHEHALFYSASGYTPAAIEYAETAGIALFSFGPWGDVSIVNSHAELLVPGAGERAALIQKETEALAEVHRQFLIRRVVLIQVNNFLRENMGQARLTDEFMRLAIESDEATAEYWVISEKAPMNYLAMNLALDRIEKYLFMAIEEAELNPPPELFSELASAKERTDLIASSMPEHLGT